MKTGIALTFTMLFSAGAAWSQDQPKNDSVSTPTELAEARGGQDTGQDIVPDFLPVEKAPQPTKTSMPVYPELALKKRIEGTVWLKMIVTKEGTVNKVSPIRSTFTGPQGDTLQAEKLRDTLYRAVTELQESAVAAAKQWTFTPAIFNGKPANVWVTIPFKFKLEAGTDKTSGKAGKSKKPKGK